MGSDSEARGLLYALEVLGYMRVYEHWSERKILLKFLSILTNETK